MTMSEDRRVLAEMITCESLKDKFDIFLKYVYHHKRDVMHRAIIEIINGANPCIARVNCELTDDEYNFARLAFMMMDYKFPIDVS